MTRRVASPRRAAFTLVEILIVVVIIALLAALLLAGISKVTKVGVMATANSDLSQLNTSCEAFKNTGTGFGFFPPSQFRLPTNSPTTTVNPTDVAIETASMDLLRQMYPRWTPVVNAGVIQWDASLTTNGYVGQTLNGNQSMVLFLGGPAQNGWATDSPRDAGTASAKKGPYFDFKQDRLAAGTAFGLTAAKVFLDPFKNPPGAPNGTPYAYLASTQPGGKYQPVACFGVYAACETAGKFVNQGGVQIISAGEDGQFGLHPANTVFTGGQGVHAEGTVGADDLANFNNGNKLGVGK